MALQCANDQLENIKGRKAEYQSLSLLYFIYITVALARSQTRALDSRYLNLILLLESNTYTMLNYLESC